MTILGLCLGDDEVTILELCLGDDEVAEHVHVLYGSAVGIIVS